jgi:hypothetical protein
MNLRAVSRYSPLLPCFGWIKPVDYKDTPNSIIKSQENQTHTLICAKRISNFFLEKTLSISQVKLYNKSVKALEPRLLASIWLRHAVIYCARYDISPHRPNEGIIN